MLRSQRILLTVTIIVSLALAASAKNSKLTGKIVAYDLMRHEAKAASGVQNEEVVVLETTSQKHKYVKVVFSSAAPTQIDQKYFAGTLPLTVDILRDRSCDEKYPSFVSQVTLERIAGRYLLTDAFKSSPPGRIKMLECYDAIYKKPSH